MPQSNTPLHHPQGILIDTMTGQPIQLGPGMHPHGMMSDPHGMPGLSYPSHPGMQGQYPHFPGQPGPVHNIQIPGIHVAPSPKEHDRDRKDSRDQNKRPDKTPEKPEALSENEKKHRSRL